jgi:hypothetical protein
LRISIEEDSKYKSINVIGAPAAEKIHRPLTTMDAFKYGLTNEDHYIPIF